jgi:hypothetical protein
LSTTELLARGCPETVPEIAVSISGHFDGKRETRRTEARPSRPLFLLLVIILGGFHKLA